VVKKRILAQMVRESPAFQGTRRLPCSQDSAVGGYKESGGSSAHVYTLFKVQLNIILPSNSRFTKRSLSFMFTDHNFELPAQSDLRRASH
jgi:hypothetical protein